MRIRIICSQQLPGSPMGTLPLRPNWITSRDTLDRLAYRQTVPTVHCLILKSWSQVLSVLYHLFTPELALFFPALLTRSSEAKLAVSQMAGSHIEPTSSCVGHVSVCPILRFHFIHRGVVGHPTTNHIHLVFPVRSQHTRSPFLQKISYEHTISTF
jgi:hypothetical protein